MNTSAHLPVSESAASRIRKVKAKRAATRGRPRAEASKIMIEKPQPAVGTLQRTKSLLLAALRVWELKQRSGL